MNTLTCRMATQADLEQAAKLAHKLNLHHGIETIPDVVGLKAHWGQYDLFVAEMDEEIVGYISGFSTYEFHSARKGFEIQNLMVHNHARGQGIAERLIGFIVREKHRQGCEVFRFTVLKTNLEGVAFYQKNGFELKDGGVLYLGKISAEKLKIYLADPAGD